MVDCGQGGSNGQGQNQQGAAIEVLPASSFDPGPNGGADLPEPTFLIVVRVLRGSAGTLVRRAGPR